MGKKFTAAQQNLCSVIVENLDEEHKEKISWVADIIGTLKAADADRLARTVQLAIEDNIKLHGGNIESAQTQDALAAVLTFLFVFDNTMLYDQRSQILFDLCLLELIHLTRDGLEGGIVRGHKARGFFSHAVQIIEHGGSRLIEICDDIHIFHFGIIRLI